MLERAHTRREAKVTSVDIAAMLCANGLDPIKVQPIIGSPKADFIFVESDEFTQLMGLLRRGEVEVNFRYYQDCRSYLIGLHVKASEAAA